ncbi:MAG: hypothetical protein ACKVHP_23605, partial [Verrucomicrobiales bacterium]
QFPYNAFTSLLVRKWFHAIHQIEERIAEFDGNNVRLESQHLAELDKRTSEGFKKDAQPIWL